MDSILTVDKPATNRRLADPNSVIDELDAGETDRPRIEDWIDEASGLIEDWCHRVFALETVIETFRRQAGEGFPGMILLSRRPVSDVTSIVEDGDTLGVDDWEIDAEAGMLYRLDGFGRCGWYADEIVVTYDAGYTLPGEAAIAGVPALPPPVRRACKSLVALRWGSIGRDPGLQSEEIVGVIRQSFFPTASGTEPGMPAEIQVLLAPHVEMAV